MSRFRAALSARHRGGRSVVRRSRSAATAAGLAGAVLAVDALVASGTASAATLGEFRALAQCESGGNFGINTGNGYYGAYQFSLGTWRSLGYGGYPHQASPEVQTEAAAKLQERSGWGQWPACSRKLSLTSSRGLVDAPAPQPLTAIDAHHTGNAAVRHVLGAPVSPEFGVPGGASRLYQGGQILWSSGTGAKAVYGEIRNTYGQLGYEQGALGFPVTDEEAVPGGRRTVFQHGAIVWSPSTGAQVVKGFIRDRYESLGGSGSGLGLPVSGERPEAGGVSQSFTGGAIYFDAATATTTPVSGAVLNAYRAAGGPAGELGMPVAEAQPGDGSEVLFEGGTITATPGRSAAAVQVG